MKVIEIECTDSTNEYLKRVDCGEDLTVIARRQTAGKGTKGRNFVSGEGGLFISVMRHYENFSAENAFSIMVNACVAVCKTLEYFGIEPVIRWANDVLTGGKKICGTLIENTFSCGNICRSIVGMGINVNNDLPAELKDTATSVKQNLGKEIAVDEVAKILLNNLQKQYSVAEYKKYINWFNSRITVFTAKEQFTATALDVDESGRLIIDRNGEILSLSSAEVSLRL